MGDWQLHLCSMEKTLIWFHAYDRVNYARHFTHCFAALQNLQESHPAIFDEFQRGNFAVKRTDGVFNMLPPDQVIEQTINREQKGPAGIIGSSTNLGCVQRWVLSSHIIAEWSQDFKRSIGVEVIKLEWKNALMAEHIFVDPTEYGWKRLNDGQIEIRWTLGWTNLNIDPDTSLEFMVCNCKKTKCTTNACKCKNVHLSCTDLCGCRDCENKKCSGTDEYESEISDKSEISDDEMAEMENN